MSDELLIHPERLSERPQVYEGTVGLDALPGLEDSVANDDMELRYSVTARLDGHQRKVVSCIIEGFVFLTCQTTLEAFRHEISVRDQLVLVDSEEMLPPIEEESDAEDYMVADGPIDVLDLVEEEVLLALPMVPRKPGVAEADKPVAAKPESPFAALASLRKKTD